MPTGDNALGDLGFAVGNNNSTGQETSLDNCAAGDQSEVRMSDFVGTVSGNINGQDPLGTGDLGSTSATGMETGPFPGGPKEYTVEISSSGPEFFRIENTDQAWNWLPTSAFDLILEEVGSNDVDAFIETDPEASAGTPIGFDIGCEVQDEYNYSSNTVSTTVQADSIISIDSFSYTVDDVNNTGNLSFEFTANNTDQYSWRLINISGSVQNQIISNIVFGDGLYGANNIRDSFTAGFSDYVELRITNQTTGEIETEAQLAGTSTSPF
jgi:hypothetical protein